MNPTGIEPIDKRIMVRCDPVQEKIGSIYLSDQTKEKDEWATTTGTLVAVGACAWTESIRDRADFHPPAIGTRVMFARYAKHAEIKLGDDKFWIMNDEDIVGFETEAK
jgi:co-chaperonin GroES (HSP10)